MRKASLRRTHRQVIYLNDKELAAVKEYCDRFGVKERSTIFREAAMNSVGFSDLPNPLHPLPGGQTAFRPVGRSRLVASLRKF